MYVLPTFNLNCNIWREITWGNIVPVVIPPPDLVSPCNLAFGRRVTGLFDFHLSLLLPAHTDVRDPVKALSAFGEGDIVEVPVASGRYYSVQYVEDAGKGFANEHRVCQIIADSNAYPWLPFWPVPYP